MEYVEPLQGGARGHQQNRQIRLQKASMNGFCVSWAADPDTKVYGCTVPLRFHSLSTDFSLLKGVKGVSVRRCAKTVISSSEGKEGVTNYDSEISYCVVKLFRDHGAERKVSSDEVHVKKKIERLHKQITERKFSTNLDGLSREYDLMDGGKSGNDLHLGLALTTKLLSSTFQVIGFGPRGNEKMIPISILLFYHADQIL